MMTNRKNETNGTATEHALDQALRNLTDAGITTIEVAACPDPHCEICVPTSVPFAA